MGLRVTWDHEEFATTVEDFLVARSERNVLATVLHTVRAGGGFGTEPPLFASLTDDSTGAVVAAAIRTPPRPLIATGFDRPGTARELMSVWLRHDPEPPGVSADPAAARAIGDAYTMLTGGTRELEFDEALHVLTEVAAPPRPARGELRAAYGQEHETLVRWELEFARETGFGTVDRDHAQASVARRCRWGFQYLWVGPDGTPVCTVCHNHPIAETVRIGPVYTPPEHRGHGYASSAVAALSQMLLDAGARQCMLFTDLANPTSNKIYASIGYVRVGSWEEHRFHPPEQLRN